MFKFCYISNFTPSKESQEALIQIERITQSAFLLSKLMMAASLFQLFGGRKSFNGVSGASSAYNISTYDWGLLQNAFSGIHSIHRYQISQIAQTQIIFQSGVDQLFWQCVNNALD